MKKTWSRVLATVLVLAMVLCMPGFAASVADTTDFESDRATSADELTDADLPELLSASGNHYPIVLVHGLFGWGGTEVLGLNYWGGFSSLRDILNNAGYKVYTPSIGPVASNWDRACELYAYLVGGTVDYGAYHSATNGHARYGRTFPGVLPELNNPDSELKVHLVGHSMGGETIRMLAQLLENGDADERNATARDQLLHTLAASAGVVLAVSFQQVNYAPDAETGSERYNQRLQYFYCTVEKLHPKTRSRAARNAQAASPAPASFHLI